MPPLTKVLAPAAATERDRLQGRGSTANRINFAWLVRLRWGAVLGQLATIFVVRALMQIELRLVPLVTIALVGAASNAVAMLWVRRRTDVPEAALVVLLAFDVLSLTGLLIFSGGPFNPFSFLYLVHIALAAVVLRSAWTWALVFLSMAASGALFFGHVWLPLEPATADSHMQHMAMHLQGMWVAFAVAAAFIVHFVTRIQRALARREADLKKERSIAARNEKLLALATLAAGAAHELATPLATIAVAARELEREALRLGGAGSDDVQLIRAQVDRCRAILDQMAADAGERAGEGLVKVPVGTLLQAITSEVRPQPPVRIDASNDVQRRELLLPQRAIVQALRGIVNNAQEASPPGGEVVISAHGDERALRMEVADHGAGMSQETLDRIGEPFFTTKPPGKGMGLGLFLARTIIDRLGGEFDIASAPGQGTQVRIVLPFDPL